MGEKFGSKVKWFHSNNIVLLIMVTWLIFLIFESEWAVVARGSLNPVVLSTDKARIEPYGRLGMDSTLVHIEIKKIRSPNCVFSKLQWYLVEPGTGYRSEITARFFGSKELATRGILRRTIYLEGVSVDQVYRSVATVTHNCYNMFGVWPTKSSLFVGSEVYYD